VRWDAAAIVAQQDNLIYESTGVNKREHDVEKGRRWVADCTDDDRQLYLELRLMRETFDELVRRLRTQKLVSNSQISVEEKVLTFLCVCWQGAGWRDTRYRCGRSLATITS
jgi:hypothetical protein